MEERKTYRKKHGNADFDANSIGRVPPQSIDLERAVLGALMIEKSAIDEVVEIIKAPEVFYKDGHMRIWTAIRDLFYANEPIDLLTVTEQLKKSGSLESAGGAFYIAQLTNTVGTAANIEFHARLLVEHYIKRQVITKATEAIRKAYEEETDAFELMTDAAASFDNISGEALSTGSDSFENAVAEEYERTLQANKNPEQIVGVPTFSPAIDQGCGGWYRGNLIIIAGRPAMGKTTVGLHTARLQAKEGIPVGFVSLEMTRQELIRKMLSAEATIDTKFIQRGNLQPYELDRFRDAMLKLKEYPLHIDDRPGLTVNQIVALARSWKKKHAIQVLYIDYLQLIRTGDAGRKFGTRDLEIGYISGSLKALAKTLDIPVIAFAQLSRDIEKRGGDKRPGLSDLRESGNLEQDADTVIFVYRPEYYDITHDADGNEYPLHLTLLDFAKFRHGKPGEIHWISELKYSRYHDLDSGIEQENNQQGFTRIESEEPPFDKF